MSEKKKDLSKKEKLLVVIYEMTKEQPDLLKYEDISVKAYKKYQKDFQLRGYPEHVDKARTCISASTRCARRNILDKYIKKTCAVHH